jgi:hypothetical protein
MSVAPPRKKNRLVFWIAIAVIAVAIVATVLLANDKRNLKALAHRYGVTWFDEVPKAPGPIAAAEPKRPQPRNVKVPKHAFDAVIPATAATFTRYWRISGDELCAHLTQAGLDVGPWTQSGFDAGTYECSHMLEGKPAGQPDDAASLFVIARGTPSGEVSGLRMKLIAPDTDEGRAMREKFSAVVDTLVKETQWSDFRESLDAVGRLENATQAAFGAKLTFSHEFADPRRFNFILELNRATPDERRSAAYFDREKWLASPDPAKATN